MARAKKPEKKIQVVEREGDCVTLVFMKAFSHTECLNRCGGTIEDYTAKDEDSGACNYIETLGNYVVITFSNSEGECINYIGLKKDFV